MAKTENIKVADFKEFKKLIKDEKTIAFNGINIKVKQYLDIKDKQVIITVIKNMAFDKDKNGVDQLNPVLMEIAYVCTILNNYTNLTLINKDDYESFNIAKGSGLFDKVCEAIPESEINFIESNIDNYIEYKLEELSNRNQMLEKIQEIIYGVIEKLPKEMDMKNIISQLNGADKDKIEFFKDALSINKNGKKKE